MAKDKLAPGDIVDLGDGVVATQEENYGAALSLESSGEPNVPKAIVAYPGARAVIGSTDLEFGLRVPNTSDTWANDWVLAGLTLRGFVQAADIGGSGSSRWRIIGNDISCPMGDGQTGCFAAALASHIFFLGNKVHDISAGASQQPSKQYHAVYFTTDTNHIEVGWNDIRNNRTCRAIQFHSSPLCTPDCGSSDTTGFNQYDLSVHDNWIREILVTASTSPPLIQPRDQSVPITISSSTAVLALIPLMETPLCLYLCGRGTITGTMARESCGL
ncbi:MAG: hypothetical protein IPL78_21945 [Chloroflexi bacterium]|nr:hypothetical protein [Chloroflexota bacterium]